MEQSSHVRLFSPLETYRILYQGMRTSISHLCRGKKKNEVSKEFAERIMLAVTEVNGCDLCSYVHTRIALESGMSRNEIGAMLSGDTDTVPADEAVAVAFAQHYADSRGNPDRKAWERLLEVYGEETSLAILRNIRSIMMGNAIGIPYSVFLRRLKGEALKKSSLIYEVMMILAPVIFFPVAAVHLLVSIPFFHQSPGIPGR